LKTFPFKKTNFSIFPWPGGYSLAIASANLMDVPVIGREISNLTLLNYLKTAPKICRKWNLSTKISKEFEIIMEISAGV